MTDPVNVLFVCTANICRSAYAEVRARSLLGRRTATISSAGTWGFDAAPMDEAMATQATARGLDPSGFKSRRLTASLIDEADVILTAGREHRAFILDDWPGALRKTFTVTQFAEAIAELDHGLHGADLIAAARARRNSPREDGDIADPYRRGSAASAACAREIDDLLTQIIPRLAQ